jgi:lysozyme
MRRVSTSVCRPLAMSAAEAETMLLADCADAGDVIQHLVKVPIRQTQFDALVSFVINFGGAKFEKSTLLKLINDHCLLEAAKQFDRWIYGLNAKTGKHEILNGLVLRRADEREMFES